MNFIDVLLRFDISYCHNETIISHLKGYHEQSHLHKTSTYKLYILPEETIVDPRFSPCKIQSQCSSIDLLVKLVIDKLCTLHLGYIR